MRKNWQEIRLEEALDYVQPTKFIVKSTAYDDSYKTPVLTPGKSFILGFTDETDGIYQNIPTIIFDDFTTEFKYVDFPFKVKSSAMKMLELKSAEYDIKFLYYLMQTLNFNSTEHKRYWISKYSKQKVNVPPLAEQKQIAAILDAADSLRQKDQQLIEHYTALSQSLFLEMFGDPTINPMGWDKVEFGSVGALDRGKSKHRPRNDPILLGGEHPLIQTGDIANSGGYITKYTSTYSDIGLKQSKKWKAGTLCITIAANIAKTGILTFDACFPDSVVGFINNEKSNTSYVQIWLSFLQKIIEDAAPMAAQKNINLKILRELEIPLPPIELQNQFAERIAIIEQQKHQAQTNLEKSEALFNSLLQRAFTGELTADKAA